MAETNPPEKPATLREQSGAVVSDVRDAVLHATRHLEALVELFRLELHEYRRCQVRRLVAVAVGAVMLLCSYMLLCLYAVVALQPYLGLLWSFMAVFMFNLIVGLAVLLVAALRRPTAIAPATSQEIKNDIECIKLYLKGKEKS